MINLINTDHIISIESFDESINDCYSLKSKLNVWVFLFPLGFYYNGTYIGKYVQSLNLHNKNVVYKNGKIYNKPYILIHTTAKYDVWERVYFDNKYHMDDFYNKLIYRNKNIVTI